MQVTDDGGIVYLSPDPAMLNWKVPLRPHLGTLAVMPDNTDNYIDGAAPGGASTIPPSRFGGNIDGAFVVVMLGYFEHLTQVSSFHTSHLLS
jgi:acetamidase/formamidase